MNNKLLSCLIAGALSYDACSCVTGARSRRRWRWRRWRRWAWRRHGRWHAGGGMGGGHGGGMGGGCMSAAWAAACASAAWAAARVSAAAHFARRAVLQRMRMPFCACCILAPVFKVRVPDGFHHRFFHHRFHRFAFIGAPFAYAAYDSCWRRVWTPMDCSGSTSAATTVTTDALAIDATPRPYRSGELLERRLTRRLYRVPSRRRSS